MATHSSIIAWKIPWTQEPGGLQSIGLQRSSWQLDGETVETVTDFIFLLFMASLVAQMVKRLPAVRETWVQSLGWEDSLEKEMATHSSTLAWKIL